MQGTGSGSYNKIVLTKSNLTPVAGKDWEYSGQVYCKLSFNNYTVDTKTVTVTINTCTMQNTPTKQMPTVRRTV